MAENTSRTSEIITKLIKNIEQVIIGKTDVIRLTLITLLSQGHLLIADPPGTGKTIMARTIAKSIDCSFSRIQFTPDMLPGDVTGVSVFNQKTAEFEFRPGPVMAQIVLADEINRANPRVQSALLECMGERQISMDGKTYPMPTPFHILATENPVEHESTFPLPETQMDRFLMSISMGYPSPDDEINILDKQRAGHPIDLVEPVTNTEEMIELQQAVNTVHADRSIREYIVNITSATRSHDALVLGASPRGSLALFQAARARALMENRLYVLPDDIKALVVPVLAHRIQPVYTDSSRDSMAASILNEIVENIPVPGVPHS